MYIVILLHSPPVPPPPVIIRSSRGFVESREAPLSLGLDQTASCENQQCNKIIHLINCSCCRKNLFWGNGKWASDKIRNFNDMIRAIPKINWKGQSTSLYFCGSIELFCVMFDLDFFLTSGDLKRNGVPPRPYNLDRYSSHTNNCFDMEIGPRRTLESKRYLQ